MAVFARHFFAEAISRLPDQEIASLRNARKNSKNYVFAQALLHDFNVGAFY